MGTPNTAVKYFKTTFATVAEEPVIIMPFILGSVLLYDLGTGEQFHAFIVGSMNEIHPGYIVAVQHTRVYYCDHLRDEDIFIAELPNLAHIRGSDQTISAKENAECIQKTMTATA